MKYLVVSVILFFCTLQTFGQQEYFIYLQTDNSQAFYVRINNNIYSSTASGYLILSKLPDSTANVTIGFAKNVFPEQQFNIPVNHKDGGYLLKSFGDKGWGLFNLQTLAVIMNSNPPEEKKSPEITGSKKSDAFTMLLANAVNDTAVLYTVNKPKKPDLPPAVAVVSEKTADTSSIVNEDPIKKEINALVKTVIEKKDSNQVAKTTKQLKDSIPEVNAHIPVNNDSATAAAKKKATHDSSTLAKNNPVPVIISDAPKSVEEKNNPDTNVKSISKSRKDTIIIGSNNPPPVLVAATKPKPDRRDTIIIMKSRVLEDKKAVTKAATPPKDDKLQADKKRDSLAVVKNEDINRQGEKKAVSANNLPPVIVPRLPARKDTVLTNTAVKSDTSSALVKTINAPEEKKDMLPDVPSKRMRPALTKVTELFTDTSYVAIYLDESKDKFDTIRISIPFAEAEAVAKTVENKPAIVATIPPVEKNKTTKDSNNAAAAQQQSTSVVTKDSNTISKSAKDSIPDVVQQAPPIVKNDGVSTAVTDSAKTNKKTPAAITNSDCKEMALDSDIDKLRIRMLLVTSDDDRITVAKKVYRLKCFSVKQVRALSELYKSDEGKYKWFDAVYPFVSDGGNFASLAELLKNEYYLNRFKAMLRN